MAILKFASGGGTLRHHHKKAYRYEQEMENLKNRKMKLALDVKRTLPPKTSNPLLRNWFGAEAL